MGPLQHDSNEMVSPTSVVASNSGSVTTNGFVVLESDVSTNGMDVLPRCCKNCFLNGVKKLVSFILTTSFRLCFCTCSSNIFLKMAFMARAASFLLGGLSKVN